MPKQQTDASRVRTEPLTEAQLAKLLSILVKRSLQIDVRTLADKTLSLSLEDQNIATAAIATEIDELGPSDDDRSERESELFELLSRVGSIVPDDGSAVRDTSNDPSCSFCGKLQSEGVKLIAGPAVFICDECVQLCVTILGSERPEWLEQHKKFIAETDWTQLRNQIKPTPEK